MFYDRATYVPPCILFSLDERDNKQASDNAQLLNQHYPEDEYLPLQLDDTGRASGSQEHGGPGNVQGALEEYYTPMDPINLANHSQNPPEQLGEEYYVVVDNQHRSPYKEEKSANREEEYYTPMDAGIASRNPAAVLPGNQPTGANAISPLGGAKVGQELANSTDYGPEPRDRSDTVIEYQNTTEWTAAQRVPPSTQRYVNFTPAMKKEGDKQQNKAGARTQPAGVSKKPPQTAPKPAKNEELPIYGNISTQEHTNRGTEEEDNDSEASDPDEEYVVSY